MQYALAISAFFEAIRPFIPLAAAGVRFAQKIVGEALPALNRMIDEGRAPTPEEWAIVNRERGALLAKLNSDTE